MIFFVLALFVALFGTSLAQQRGPIERYLKSVYSVGDFSSLSDDQLFAFYDNLTFYYDGAPPSPVQRKNHPNGRVQSWQYAGTTCDCLHIDLPQCVAKTPGFGNCEYWNMTTYMDMEWVKEQVALPSYSWYEGLTYPGEWGWPLSCRDSSWMKDEVYGFWGHMWLYPTKGLGVWWNVGNTAAAPNKVAWLLEHSDGQIGSNKTEMMEWMADYSCPNYRQFTSCKVCSNPIVQGQCCCHGSGRNLGVQVTAYKNYARVSWAQALDDVADMYLQGQFGEERRSSWPHGTFFGYVNLFDDMIMEVMYDHDYLTAQFVREPQHRQVANEFADPVYSFEILAQWPRNVWGWDTFCRTDGVDFGLLDPVANYDQYLANGFLVVDNKTTKVLPSTQWNAPNSFSRIFDENQAHASVNAQAPHLKKPSHGRW